MVLQFNPTYYFEISQRFSWVRDIIMFLTYKVSFVIGVRHPENYGPHYGSRDCCVNRSGTLYVSVCS